MNFRIPKQIHPKLTASFFHQGLHRQFSTWGCISKGKILNWSSSIRMSIVQKYKERIYPWHKSILKARILKNCWPDFSFVTFQIAKFYLLGTFWLENPQFNSFRGIRDSSDVAKVVISSRKARFSNSKFPNRLDLIFYFKFSISSFFTCGQLRKKFVGISSAIGILTVQKVHCL